MNIRISTTAWVIIILLLVIIGESIYIYYTKPKPSATTDQIIASKKSIDSVVWIKDSSIVELKQRIIYYEGLYDDIFQQNKELRGSFKSVEHQIVDIGDSLDYYRAKTDTPRFVVACDSLQIASDSLVMRTKKLDSVLIVSDNLIWLVGRQKDSVNDVLMAEVLTLRVHDSTITKQYVYERKQADKQKKSDSFLKKLYIGLGIAAAVATAIFVK